MYQWKEESKSETKKKLGGGEETVTTYTYSKVWDDGQIDSVGLQEAGRPSNPPMEIHQPDRSRFRMASSAPSRSTRRCSTASTATRTFAVAAEPGRRRSRPPIPATKRVSVVDGSIYLGPTDIAGARRLPDRLRTGADRRRQHHRRSQTGAGSQPYQTKAGDQLLMVDTGNVPAEKMFADAVTANTMITWLLRAGRPVL